MLRGVKRMRPWQIAGVGVGAFMLFVFFNNTSLLAPAPKVKPFLLAHRGISQTFPMKGVKNDTCTARLIYPPTNPYLENTIASMRASFRAGADIVEFDVHPTTDGQFAVFHDWTLDCRTNGHGVTRAHSIAELKALDIGYGYTADGGKTFPFRGKGVGLIPTLAEVLATFPHKRFLINIKSNDPAEGEQLAAWLSRLPPERRGLLMVYGGSRPIAAVRAGVAGVRTMAPRGSSASLLTCLWRYTALGWSGYVPEACRRSIVIVPLNYAPWLWGWPARFLARMNDAGSLVVVAGPYHGGDALGGLDRAEELATLPKNYSGGIWTNEIERIAPLLHDR